MELGSSVGRGGSRRAANLCFSPACLASIKAAKSGLLDRELGRDFSSPLLKLIREQPFDWLAVIGKRLHGLLPACRQSAQNPTGTSHIAVSGPRPPDFEYPLQELRATQKQDGQSQPEFGLRLCHSVACS